MTNRIFTVILFIAFSVSLCPAQRRFNSETSLQEALLKNVTRESVIETDRLHDQWIGDHLFKPFTRVFQYERPVLQSLYDDMKKKGNTSRLLIIADLKLYKNPSARAKIDRYADDIHHSHHGCHIILETVSGGTPQDIKAMIKDYYDNTGLDGVVFIGQVVPAWFEVKNDHYWWEDLDMPSGHVTYFIWI